MPMLSAWHRRCLAHKRRTAPPLPFTAQCGQEGIIYLIAAILPDTVELAVSTAALLCFCLG
jgi:hypothetical protein